MLELGGTFFIAMLKLVPFAILGKEAMLFEEVLGIGKAIKFSCNFFHVKGFVIC
jgi:hypothetical protein